MSLAGKAHVAVVGAGPAGLIAAEVLSDAGVRVTVLEHKSSPGRKFLLAGRGGLNLTHSEPLGQFLMRYGNAATMLRPAIEAFPPDALRTWCEALGQPTFVGSSGRVFPRAMKASPLLRAWLRRLAAQGVTLRVNHAWIGWDDNGRLLARGPDGVIEMAADATILALGGASWPHLGSNGQWVTEMERAGISVNPLWPANCGFLVAWTDVFRTRFAGSPLKRLGLTFRGRSVRGEAVVTRTGLEGGGIYALSEPLREVIRAEGRALLHIDLRPDMPAATLEQRFAVRQGKLSLANFLRKAARLSPVEIGLLHEAALADAGRLTDMTPAELAALVKAVPVTLAGIAPIERAISTAGGIAFSEVDEHFMLRRKPGVFVAGEMLDWEAPTGGYLLQAAFATGAAAARGALAWLSAR